MISRSFEQFFLASFYGKLVLVVFQTFIALGSGKCKRNVNILSIILVQDFRLKLKLLAISYRIWSYCALMLFFAKFYNIT